MKIIILSAFFLVCIAACIIVFFATKKKKDKLLSRILYLFLPFFAYLAGAILFLLLIACGVALSSDRGEGMLLVTLAMVIYIIMINPIISALMGILGRSKRKFDIKMATANTCTLVILGFWIPFADISTFLYFLLYAAIMFLISLIFSHIKIRREIQNIDEDIALQNC